MASYASRRARERRLRARYRRKIFFAGLIMLIIGLVAGYLVTTMYIVPAEQQGRGTVVMPTPTAQPAATQEPVAEEAAPAALTIIDPETEAAEVPAEEAAPAIELELEPVAEVTEAPVVTEAPTAEPTAVPTAAPTEVPAEEPVVEPASEQTSLNLGGLLGILGNLANEAELAAVTPTPVPTEVPVVTEAPTAVPTAEPTAVPTAEPTAVPTAEPTTVPTAEPTAEPNMDALLTNALNVLTAGGELPAIEAAPAEVPAEVPAEAPAEVPAEAPVAEVVEEVAAAPAEVPAEEAAPAITPIVVPYGQSMNIQTQIKADGTARREADADAFETLNLTMNVAAYKDPAYFEANYADSYNLQGNEAAVQFDMTLNGYTGTTEIIPQNFLLITFRGETDEATTQGFQLMDSEIAGKTEIAVATDTPTTLYKRYPYNADQGHMNYMVVTAYNDGAETVYWFEIQNPNAEAEAAAAAAAEAASALTVGSQGDDVKRLQAKLIELGLLQGQPDGKFGNYTAGAVKELQKRYGMEATGIADNAFLEKLYN